MTIHRGAVVVAPLFLPKNAIMVYTKSVKKAYQMARKKLEQPKKLQTFKVTQEFKSFLQSLDNASQFFVDTLKATPEYKNFERKIYEQKNIPSLFAD